jgi:hypothetical protein
VAFRILGQLTHVSLSPLRSVRTDVNDFKSA